MFGLLAGIAPMRLVAALAIAIALAASHWKVYRLGAQGAELACSAERTAAAQAAQAKADANRTTARAAEVRYAVRDQVRVVTLRETLEVVKNETQNLAACRLDAGDVGVLNAAANRAGGNRPAAGAADVALPAPAAPDQ